MKKLAIFAGAAALCVALPVLANEMKGDAMFKMMDTNGDGYVSKSEHDAFAKQKFMKADTNHDGKISMQEMTDMKKMEYGETSPDDSKSNVKDMKPASGGMTATGSAHSGAAGSMTNSSTDMGTGTATGTPPVTGGGSRNQ
jgi:hypothetical protein